MNFFWGIGANDRSNVSELIQEMPGDCDTSWALLISAINIPSAAPPASRRRLQTGNALALDRHQADTRHTYRVRRDRSQLWCTIAGSPEGTEKTPPQPHTKPGRPGGGYMKSKIQGLLVAGLLAGPITGQAAVTFSTDTATDLVGKFSVTGTSVDSATPSAFNFGLSNCMTVRAARSTTATVRGRRRTHPEGGRAPGDREPDNHPDSACGTRGALSRSLHPDLQVDRRDRTNHAPATNAFEANGSSGAVLFCDMPSVITLLLLVYPGPAVTALRETHQVRMRGRLASGPGARRLPGA